MTLTVSKHMNLVVPVDRDDGTRLHVHAAPIAYEVFQRYHLVLAKTWSVIGQQGLHAIAGPRTAWLLLQDVAKGTARGTWDDQTGRPMTWWEGPDGVGRGLGVEMVRLANVLAPRADGGWDALPLDTVIKQGQLDEEERGDVLNQLAFFTVAWHAAPRADRRAIVTAAASLYSSQTTSSSATAYASSLTMSKPDESGGEKSETDAPASSPPPLPKSPAPAGQPSSSASVPR